MSGRAAVGRALTASEKEALWRLDCAVPARLSYRVGKSRSPVSFRLRDVNAPSYALLRDMAVRLLADGVSPSVLAVELAMDAASMHKWRRAAAVPAPREGS